MDIGGRGRLGTTVYRQGPEVSGHTPYAMRVIAGFAAAISKCAGPHSHGRAMMDVMDESVPKRWTCELPDPLGHDHHIPHIRTLTAADLQVVFQPIVDLKTGHIFAAEALVRCERPELRTPKALFTHAVTQYACGRLGRMIREIAFQRITGLPIFINLHPAELSSRWLVRPDDPMCFYDYPVYLEVTEVAAFEFFELCRDVLNEVKQRAGVHVVVDDFGAGYSSLSRIVDLEPAIVKLDQSLIAGICRKPRQRILVEHVVRLCEELGARVVAEGIEHLDDLLAVRDSGVHFAQGYLLARPAYPIPVVSWPLT